MLARLKSGNGKGKFYTNSEHGTRLIFTEGLVNPRNELGKIGVSFHHWFAAWFRRTITWSLAIENEKGVTRTEKVYIDRQSLVKYLRGAGQEIRGDESDRRLEFCLNTALEQKNQNSKGQNLRHAGQHNTRSLSRFGLGAISDFFRGKFFSWLYQKTIGGLSALRKRFFFASTESKYFEVSEILAKKRFNEAADTVPAYKDFLAQDATFPTKKQKKFKDVPVTSKANYIQPNFSHDWDLHADGKYSAQQKVDTSTGTTGKPAVWSRSEAEVSVVKKSLQVAAEIDFGDRRVHYINAFALGPWATGMTAYELMRENGSAIAVGPDIGKILDELDRMHRYEQHLIDDALMAFMKKHPRHLSLAVKPVLINLVNVLLNQWLDKGDSFDLSAEFDAALQLPSISKPGLLKYKSDLLEVVRELNKVKSQFVLAGYPPFLKDVVDKAKEQNIDFKQYHVRGIVGGQAISEALRDKLIESGFSRINSSYGASDLDINIGVETDFEIQFRKVLEKNPAIQAELFGPYKGLPMVFHFDPFNYHIEVSDDDDLLFTCNRSERSSARIRYNLGDKGRVFAASDLEAILVKHGIHNLKPRVNLPLVFVWGRDSAVAYRGCKVAFTDLERAITNIDPDNLCVKRAMYSSHDKQGNEQFSILIELKDGAENLPREDFQKFSRQLLIEMARVNQDFRSHLEIDNGAKLPQIIFFKKGTSPICDASGHRKQVLVFKEHDLPAGYQAKDADMIKVDIKKDTVFANDAKQISSDTKAAKSSRAGYATSSPRFLRMAVVEADESESESENDETLTAGAGAPQVAATV